MLYPLKALPHNFNSQPHKEADNTTKTLEILKQLFQLTASQGGWHYWLSQLRLLIHHFNSQPHKEADDLYGLAPVGVYISTHSLTRRLTIERRTICWQGTFQLTASQGGWPILIATPWVRLIFQLTASQGGWRPTTAGKAIYDYFNSQPHKEADLPVEGRWYCDYISTHSLTRRLTLCNASAESIGSISTHSLTRRLTGCTGGIALDGINFNSQPHKEADSCIITLWDIYLFQLTASQGGWPCHENMARMCVAFQLTASQGGWRAISLSTVLICSFQLTASQGGWQFEWDC